jgi:hypothetical protein
VRGAVARTNHRNTPWDQARFEMPMHRWARGPTSANLISVGKCGYNVHGNVLGVSLLRSPVYPDPYADEGEYEFVHAIYQQYPGEQRRIVSSLAGALDQALLPPVLSDLLKVGVSLAERADFTEAAGTVAASRLASQLRISSTSF